MAHVNIGGVRNLYIIDAAKNKVIDWTQFGCELEDEEDNKQSDLGWFQLVDMVEVDGVWMEVV